VLLFVRIVGRKRFPSVKHIPSLSLTWASKVLILTAVLRLKRVDQDSWQIGKAAITAQPAVTWNILDELMLPIVR
jgi:hypothetical protein